MLLLEAEPKAVCHHTLLLEDEQRKLLLMGKHIHSSLIFFGKLKVTDNTFIQMREFIFQDMEVLRQWL